MTRIGSFLVLTWLAAVGCKGKPAAEDPASPSQSAAAPPAKVSNEAPPATPTKAADPIDDAIAGLERFKNEMCACTDAACADKVHADYKKWEEEVLEPRFDGVDPTTLDKSKLATGDKLDAERKACRRRFKDANAIASPVDAMAKLAEFTDKMCACADASCAKAVSDEMVVWSREMATSHPTMKMTETDQKNATKLGTRMGECMQRAMDH